MVSSFLTLNLILPLKVQADVKSVCSLRLLSWENVALVRSSKKGCLMRLFFSDGVLVVMVDSLRANSLRWQKTRLLQNREQKRTWIGLGEFGLPGRMWAVSSKLSQEGQKMITPLDLAPSRMGRMRAVYTVSITTWVLFSSSLYMGTLRTRMLLDCAQDSLSLRAFLRNSISQYIIYNNI